MKTVKVVDGVMGSGKTTAIFKWIDDNPNKKYIYVSPNLSEVNGVDGRIHTGVESVEFHSPVVGECPTKLAHLNQLLADGVNIACTHNLYLSMNSLSFDLIESRGYTVILDEEINVIQTYNKYSFTDVQWLMSEGYISVDETDGSLSWLKDDDRVNNFDHSYFYVKNLCDKKSLYITRYDPNSVTAKRVMMVTQIPVRMLEVAKEVVVLTYMFNGSVLDSFLKLKGWSVEPLNLIECNVKPSSFKHLITIDSDNSLDGMSMTSSWWSDEATKNGGVKAVENYILRCCRRYAESGDDVLWCIPKSRVAGFGSRRGVKTISVRGYNVDSKGEKCWLSTHTRATNIYAHKKVMIHCYNRYPLTPVAAYLQDYGQPISNDRFALSEMLQWLWRGCIRNGLPMTVCIGNKRMRKLLIRWLNDEFENS